MPVLIALALLLFNNPVSAEVEPVSFAQDKRIKTVVYDQNQVVRVRANFMITTTVEFERDEHVIDDGIVIGNAISWQVTPVQHYLIIKPQAENADSNLTVFTNKRVYNFDLSAKWASKKDKHLSYYIRFQYPQAAQAAAMRKHTDYVESQKRATERLEKALNPTQLNFDYRSQGDSVLKPVQVFDDGTFTYFKFDKKTPLPAVFSIDNENQESLINFRIEGKFLVVEQLGKRFTLRRNKQVVTVARLRRGEINPSSDTVRMETDTVFTQDNDPQSGFVFAGW